MPVTIETASVKSRTYGSMPISAERGRLSGRRGQDQASPPPGEQQADRGAAQRQQDAFRQQLAHDASAVGAQRGANGELTPSSRGARQQQIGDVGAGDDQHEPDRAHQQQQRGSNVPHHVVFHGDELGPSPRIRLRVLAGQDATDGRDLRLRRFDGDARLEAADDRDSRPRLPRAQLYRVILLDRNVDLRALAEPKGRGARRRLRCSSWR
jgi:hypothetical protein